MLTTAELRREIESAAPSWRVWTLDPPSPEGDQGPVREVLRVLVCSVDDAGTTALILECGEPRFDIELADAGRFGR